MRPLTLLTLLALPAAPLAAQPEAHSHDEPSVSPSPRLYEGLGTYRYPVTTTSEAARRYFTQGLRLFWAFNHAEAAASFREAGRLDPACALCAWGEALALGPNINAPMAPANAARARAAAERARASGTGRPAERALIEAVAARYATGDRAAADSAYARAMRVAAARFPDDPEILTLYADALMNLSPWNYWREDRSPRPDTPVILETLERALARDPDHPGACHLFIHAVEAVDPKRALPCAERLASLMPGAGHLVHMPGHIYIRVGRYADAIAANRHAVHADASYLDGPVAARRGLYPNGYYPHNWHFLSFAASMQGAGATAIDAARKTVAALDPAVVRETPWVEAVTPVVYWTLVTFGRWDAILAEPLPDPSLRFATGMAYYARGVAFAAQGRFIEAGAALDTVSAAAQVAPAGDLQTALAIAEYALAGEIALRRGRAGEAVRQFRAAAALEDGMAYGEPPVWYYPVRQSLGKALLAAGRPQEAERRYLEDLARFPENGWSLFGLMRSLERQGKRVEASRVRRRFEAAWQDADVRLTGSRF